MPYTLNYNVELHIIELKNEGDMTLEDVRERSGAAARLVKEKGATLLMNDMRQAKLQLTTAEIYRVPAMVQEILRAHGLDPLRVRRAVVVKNDKLDFQFFEAVTNNRGQPIKVFTDIDEARQWLVGPGANSSQKGIPA